MEIAPAEWLTVENLKELGAGIIIGSILSLQAVRSGIIVIGDKVKLLVENATLKERNDYLIKEIQERDAIIAGYRNSPAKE